MNEMGFEVMENLITKLVNDQYNSIDEKLKAAEELLDVAKMNAYPYGQAVASYYIASCNFLLKRNKVCIQFLELCLQITRKEKFYALEGKCCIYYGLFYASACDFILAFQYYLEAAEATKKANDYCSTGIVYNNIASIFQEHGDYENARLFYSKSYDETLKGNSPFLSEHLLVVLSNFSEISRLTGRYDDAKKYLDLCEIYLKDNISKSKEYLIECTKACYLLDIGEISEAHQIIDNLFNQSIETLDDQYFSFVILETLCKALLTAKDQAYAYRVLQKLLAFNKSDDLLSIQSIAKLRVQYYEIFNDPIQLAKSYQQFYEVFERSQKGTDKLLTERLEEKIKIFEMINEMRKENDLLEKEANTLHDIANVDELTGLYNRRFFQKQITKSYPSNSIIGIIMIDVDYFKEYNDTYGHTMGDYALRVIASCMKAQQTESFIPCRYGGDEFVCVTIDIPLDVMTSIIERIQMKLKEQAIEHRKSKSSQILSVSIGYCCRTLEQAGDIQKIIDQADLALYDSKVKGRNTSNFR